MSAIIPALIPRSRHHLDVALASTGAFSDQVQVDIVDGVFAPVASWPYTLDVSLQESLQSLQFHTTGVELDLMIAKPEDSIDAWQRTGATHIIVHLESINNIDTIFAHHRENLYMLGVSIGNDTDLDLLLNIDPANYDYVQLMGIAEIGTQGQPFDERVISRIETLHKIYPNLLISIDGSMNTDTIPLVARAGARRFVVGSAIVNAPDPSKVYRHLTTLVD